MPRIMGSHNLLVGGPFRHSVFVLCGRDSGLLGDMSSTALKQLTHVLICSETDNIDTLSVSKREFIQRAILNLDHRLRRPCNLLDRFAIRVGARGFSGVFPGVASLCRTHYLLDPRIVRNLMRLVYAEAMARTDRYRIAAKASGRSDVSNELTTNVHGWVDWMDAIVIMRLDAEQFALRYGYEPVYVKRGRVPAKSECEACTLAVVGGHWKMLASLKLSVQMRANAYVTGRRGLRPRLLPILESWIACHGKDGRSWIEGWVQARLPDVVRAREVILEATEKRIQKVRGDGEQALLAKFRAKVEYQFDHDPNFNVGDFTARAVGYCPCNDGTAASVGVPGSGCPDQEPSKEAGIGRPVHY